MYTPPNENLIWSVHRLRSTFVDSIGNSMTAIGTGFWLSGAEGQRFFITNKHNVDMALKLASSSSGWRLTTAEIELRRWSDRGPTTETSFFTVADLGCIASSPVADCAVFISPELLSRVESDFPIADLTKFDDVATREEFQAGRINLMEPAIFIGFPGAKGRHWWDETWKLPVARECIIASWPGIPFSNTQIATEDVLLVSGLSFSGSSGSPVFVQERGLRPGGAVQSVAWRSARLIGIMSGHFWDEGQTPSMFAHSGLSYLTRSTAIIDTLRDTGTSTASGA